MKKPDKAITRVRISRLVYIPVIASLIPVLGIPFGISALLWGIADWKIGGKKAAIIACLGFLLTILLGLSVYSVVGQVEKAILMSEYKVNYSQGSLANLVRYIEYYKLGHGHYPNSLMDLIEKDNTDTKNKLFTDPFSYSWIVSFGNSGEQPFFYEVDQNGKFYDLFSVGPDKIPHTQDDIFPIVLDDYKSILGIRTRTATSP